DRLLRLGRALPALERVVSDAATLGIGSLRRASPPRRSASRNAHRYEPKRPARRWPKSLVLWYRLSPARTGDPQIHNLRTPHFPGFPSASLNVHIHPRKQRLALWGSVERQPSCSPKFPCFPAPVVAMWLLRWLLPRGC